jgi:phage terminase large subunit GpA-like protein
VSLAVKYSSGLRELRRLVVAAAVEIFQPLPKLTVSEAADQHRILPQTSPEPGRFRTSRVPYMRRIMDVMGDDAIHLIVFAKSSQVGGSSVGENWLLYIMTYAPGAILQVWPSENKLKKWTQTRLDPMIEDSPILRAKFPRTGRRDAGDSLSFKEFPGGWLKMITAKSTIELKSDSSRNAVAEEIDEWEYDLNDQGDPFELLLVRLRNYFNWKLFIPSTPTVEGRSKVWKLLSQTTFERYWVPCPHCGEFQTLEWRDGEIDGDDAGQYRLIFDRDEEGGVIPGTTKYLCAHCACLIDERKKTWMLERGEWRPRFPGRQWVGFHINTLYSPFCPWDDIATSFLRAKGDQAAMKVFVNTFLGLPYREPGEALNPHFLAKRADHYGAEIPHGVGLLTAGVDVQGDRLELFVWGWGAEERSWVIRWEQIYGDPGHDEVWRQLDEWLLRREWQHEDGAKLRLAAVAIDAGHMAERVWRYASARSHYRILATVGRAGRGKKLIEAPAKEKLKRARTQKKPMHVVGVDSGKDLLASRLRITDEKVPGYIHFPDTLDPVFFEQITAEKIVTKYEHGRPVRVWELPMGKRNEALDGAVLNMAALAYLGLPVIKQLGALAERVSEQGRAGAGGQAPKAAEPPAWRVLSKGIE